MILSGIKFETARVGTWEVGQFFITYISRYTYMIFIPTKQKEIEGHFWYPVRLSILSIKLALQAHRVYAKLDPGGRGKDLVGKGSGTVRTRLVAVDARLATVCARPAWSHLAACCLPCESYPNSPTWPNIFGKKFKKGLFSLLFWNTLRLAWFFKNTFPHSTFENHIPTSQLSIKFWNP